MRRNRMLFIIAMLLMFSTAPSRGSTYYFAGANYAQISRTVVFEGCIQTSPSLGPVLTGYPASSVAGPARIR
jgi:hypothetical protein